MHPIRACMMGKIGIGKSTLISNLLGKDAKEHPEMSKTRRGGCTKGIQRYGGQGQKYELYDSEGAFGLEDDFPDLVNKLANNLAGKKLHVMCCCINAQGLTRLDTETLESLLMCAGILGDVGAKNLLIVFTRCDSKEAKETAVEIFDALNEVATDEEYLRKFEGKTSHIARGVHPLFTGIRDGMLGFAMVEKENVAGVAQALDALSNVRGEVLVTPSAWVLGKRVWEDVRKGIQRIVTTFARVTPFAPCAAKAAEVAGMPSLKQFLDIIAALPVPEAPPADAPIMFYPPKDMSSWVNLGRDNASVGITSRPAPCGEKADSTQQAAKKRGSESQGTEETTAKKRARLP